MLHITMLSIMAMYNTVLLSNYKVGYSFIIVHRPGWNHVFNEAGIPI